MDWLEQALGFLSGLAGFLLTPLRSVFRAVVHFLQQAIDLVSSVATEAWNLVHDLTTAVWRMSDAVWQALDRLAHTVSDAVWAAIRQAAAGVEQLARGLAAGVQGFARQIVDELGADLRAGARWFADNIVAPIGRLASGSWNWITRDALPFVQRIAGDLVAPIAGELRAVKDAALQAWRFVRDEGPVLLAIVRRLGGWFFDFITDPLGFITRRLAEAVQRSPGYFVDLIVSALEREGGGVEDTVARWLST